MINAKFEKAFLKLAGMKNIEVERMVNEWLRKDMELIQAAI